MKTFKTLFTLFLIIAAFAATETVYSQASPVLYFCEDYRSDEISISDVFTTGWLTVMVKSSTPIGYSDVSIDISRYDSYTDRFVYEKSVPFDITPSMDYVYFQDKDNLKFTSPGFYRVQLTANNRGTVLASSIVRIISR